MLLQTLGRLKLSGEEFRQDKPLLLVAYLALEGPKPRKFIAELFWPTTVKPMESLAGAVFRLRKHHLVEADRARVWASVGCDALELREHLRAGRLNEAVALYSGAFAEGLAVEMEEELEEWLLETREKLAAEVRMALLSLAEQEAARGAFAEAAAKAEAAYGLPSAALLEAEDLLRLHRLLLAAEHPLKETLAREAKELGVLLGQSAKEAQIMLRQTLIGRSKEIEMLMALDPGEWAWVQGGDGMGKTLLLRHLEGKGNWRYLPARSGLPFATLEPLLSNTEGGTEVIFRRIAASQTHLLFDDWENIDPESQQVLERLCKLRPGFAVIVASNALPAFSTDLHLELGPLKPEELTPHPGAYEATDGIPGLVASWLRSEPLESALESRLHTLVAYARDMYGALALLEEPDLSLVRKGLGLEASEVATALETLLASGLIDPSGRVRARRAALNYLANHPRLRARLSLLLARHLDHTVALPHYRLAKPLWEDSDTPQIAQAYIGWAKELLHRGFPVKAAELLQDAPETPETIFLQARAQEQSGRNHLVIELLEKLPTSPETLALKSSVLVRLGEMEEARKTALEAKGGSLEAQAEVFMTLGRYQLSKGDYAVAEQLFQKAARLWLATGQNNLYVHALSNKAIAQNYRQGLDPHKFDEVLLAAQDNLQLQATVFLNISSAYSRANDHEKGLRVAEKALELAIQSEAGQSIAAAWYNIAGCYDHLEQHTQSKKAYNQCLEYAQRIDDRRLIGMSLFSLAIWDRDYSSAMEALDLMQQNGFVNLRNRFKQYLDLVKGQSQNSLHS